MESVVRDGGWVREVGAPLRSRIGKKMIQIRDFYVPVYFIYAVAQSLGGAKDTPDGVLCSRDNPHGRGG